MALNFNSSKAVWLYFANIITNEAWLTLINSNYFVNTGKYLYKRNTGKYLYNYKRNTGKYLYKRNTGKYLYKRRVW